MADTAQSIRDYLMGLASDGASYGNVILPISLQLVEPVRGEIFRLFVDCTLISEGGQDDENPDPNFEDLEFDPMWIETNEGTLFDSSQYRF